MLKILITSRLDSPAKLAAALKNFLMAAQVRRRDKQAGQFYRQETTQALVNQGLI
ncbi:MAG: hypothetical protein ABSA26_07685 [Thermoguttaceae bacterium]|jgi:hypothetical protein